MKYHLLWTDNPETLCGLVDIYTLPLTDDPDHPQLCRRCKKSADANLRPYIDNLNEGWDAEYT